VCAAVGGYLPVARDKGEFESLFFQLGGNKFKYLCF